MKKKYESPTVEILNCLSAVFNRFGERQGLAILKECFK